MRKLTPSARLILPIVLSVFSAPLFAYVGPGSGLSAIGTIFALIAAFFLAIVGFIWYPIKRLFKGNKASKRQPSASNQTQSTESADTTHTEELNHR